MLSDVYKLSAVTNKSKQSLTSLYSNKQTQLIGSFPYLIEKAKSDAWKGIRVVIQQPSLSIRLEEESNGYSEFVSWNSIVSKQCVHSSYLRRYGIRRCLCLRRKFVKIISKCTVQQRLFNGVVT